MHSDPWVRYSHDIACIYDAIWTFINAGTVFSAVGYGVGSVLPAGGVRLGLLVFLGRAPLTLILPRYDGNWG